MTPVPNSWRPPYAYVPGWPNQRHPENLFEPIKSGLSSVSVAVLHETQSWKMALRFLHEGFYWEAHELLEAVWMHCPKNSAEEKLARGILQLANARLKQRMGHPKAAQRLGDIAQKLMREAFLSSKSTVLGVAVFSDLQNL